MNYLGFIPIIVVLMVGGLFLVDAYVPSEYAGIAGVPVVIGGIVLMLGGFAKGI